MVPKLKLVSDIIGIEVVDMNSEVAAVMGLGKETLGILIISIFKGSIAEKAGLISGDIPAQLDNRRVMLGGDIIIEVDDKTINSRKDLEDFISHYHLPDTSIKFRILRNGKPIEIALFY